MLAAATGGASSSVSSSPGPYKSNRPSQARINGKTPLRGLGHGQTPPHISRRGSTNSETSDGVGGESFVEHSSDSEAGSQHAGGGRGGVEEDDGSVVDGRGGEDDGLSEVADETTAADVIRDVLRVVYPPI